MSYLIIYRGNEPRQTKFRASDLIIEKRHDLFIAMGFQYSEVTETYFNTKILHTTKRDYLERWEEDQFIDVIKHIINKFLV